MRLARDMLVYGVGDALMKASAFLTVPIYTRLFPPAEYGVLSYAMALGGLLTAVLSLGGESAYSRYFFDAGSAAERRRLTATWLAFLVVWSTIAVGLLLPLAETASRLLLETRAHAGLFAAALLGIPFALANAICAQILRNQFQPVRFVALNALTAALTVTFGLAAVLGLGLGIFGIVLGTSLAAIALLPLRLWSVRGLLGLDVSWPLLRQLLRFGTPVMVSGLAYWVFATSDRLLLERYAGLDALGAYSVAATVSMVLHLALNALGQAWSPHFLSIYRCTPDAAPRVAAHAALVILAAFGIISVGLAVFATEIVTLLSGPGYAAAVGAILPLALGVSANAMAQVTAVGISVARRTGWLATLAWPAAGLSVGLNLLLIPLFGLSGAAWTSAVIFIVLTLAYGVVSQRLWPVPYDLPRLGAVASLVLGFGLGAPHLPALPLWTALSAKALYLAIAAAALAFACGRGALRELQTLAIRGQPPSRAAVAQ